MTQGIISFEQGIEVAKRFLGKVQEFAPQAVLAGGFLRDIDNGAQPKDLDFFLQGKGTPEETLQMVKDIFGSIDHLFVKLGQTAGGEYPEHLQVYESFDFPVGDFPVNLIITPEGQSHTLSFDLSICNIYLFGPDEVVVRSWDYLEDKSGKTITIRNIRDTFLASRQEEEVHVSINALLAHVDRVLAKLVGWKVLVHEELVYKRYAQELFGRLALGGYIENPRALLQAERQKSSRNPVRLEDGATDFRGDRDRLFERWTVSNYEGRRSLTQAAPTILPHRAQVQSRPFVILDDDLGPPQESLRGD